MMWLWVAIAGGIGAVLRFIIDNQISARTSRAIPWGTIAVNVTGSFLAGLLVGLSNWGNGDLGLTAVALTGLMGGFTTASTFAVELALIAQRETTRKASVLSSSTAVAAISAALVGLVLGLAL